MVWFLFICIVCQGFLLWAVLDDVGVLQSRVDFINHRYDYVYKELRNLKFAVNNKLDKGP